MSADSVLRQLPTGLNSRQRLIFDGVRLSAEMVGLAYDRLARAAYRRTHVMTDDDDGGPTHADLFIDTWSIIDSVHRLRSLLRSPVLSPPLDAEAAPPDIPEVEIRLGGSLREGSVVTELRDSIQHLDNRIAHIDRARQPVYGTLLWVVPLSDTEAKVVIASPGSAVNWETAGFDLASMAGTARPPVDHIHLVGQQTSSRGRDAPNAEFVTGNHPGTITVSLTKLVVETARAVVAIERVLGPQFEGHPTAGSDLTMALSVDFTPTDSADDGMPGGNPMESDG